MDFFDVQQFRDTNTRVLANQAKYDQLHQRLVKALNSNDLEMLRQIIMHPFFKFEMIRT